MNTSSNTASTYDIGSLFTTCAVGLLLTHYAYVCYSAFSHEGMLGTITDRLYQVTGKFTAVTDSGPSKALTLLLLILGSIATSRPAEQKTEYKWPLITLGIGLVVFFGTALMLPIGTEQSGVFAYIVVTSLGFLTVLTAEAKLSRSVRYAFRMDRFEKDTSGFEQEQRLITTPYSLNFPARYNYNGRTHKSHINLVNPRRGMLIMGFPGAGKSWFIVEPAIEQLTQKGMALFVYDFKYPVLTDHTYNCFLQEKSEYPSSTRFYSINFTDLSRTNRCNIIAPETLQYKSDALGISKTIMLAINKTWVAKQGDFFTESSINYLAALIWFLKTYENGKFCTLPHVIELSKTPYEELFTLLNAEPSTRGLVGSFVDAYKNKTMEMLDGQIASARVPLARLDSPDFYYVLSGNDLTLDINDPEAPAILCLGGDPARNEALAPIMSLFIDRLNRQVNQPGRFPMAQVLDEFASVRATGVLNTIATGRSNNIITMLVLQDLNQLKLQYSNEEAHQIMNTTGNLICGQITGETARWISDRFHSTVQLKTTISINSSDTSISKTEQSADTVTPATLANLSSGEFIGVISDDPDTKLELKGFHATFVKTSTVENRYALPTVQPLTAADISANFERIGTEIRELIAEEMKRILADPALKTFIVKK